MEELSTHGTNSTEFKLRHFFVVVLFCFASVINAQPVITSFSPLSGPIGTEVVIRGKNFSTNLPGNVIYFGAVKANPVSCTDSTLVVNVPKGTTYQPITVTVNNLTAYSLQPFIITFNDAGNLSNNSFAAGVDITTDLHPNDLVIVDLDGDGKPDIATANNYSIAGSSASVTVLRNSSVAGNISFAPRQDIPSGVMTYAIAAGDIDGDGKQDLISGSIVDGTISVFQNTSTSGTISFAAKKDFSTGLKPYDIQVKDLDNDGKPDVAVANFTSNTISIFRNTSTGGIISFAAKVDITTGADLGPNGVTITDLDGDNKPDLAVSCEYSNTIAVFRNACTKGSISFTSQFHFYATPQPIGIVSGDIDGNGKIDLAWAKYADITSFAVELNRSTPGVWDFIATTPYNYNLTYPYSVSITDMNGDGKADIALMYYGHFRLFQNASIVGNVSMIPSGDYEGHSPFTSAIGDIDGDGLPDIVTANFTGEFVTVYKNQSIYPSVTSFSPTTAGKGVTVTIKGNNFNSATGVSFGETPAASFTIVDNTTITAVTGNGSGGEVSVTNKYGSGKLPGFSFAAPPVIKTFTPAAADSGITVTLTGINFIEVKSVSFGGTAASAFTVVSPTKIEAVVGNGTTGAISVTNTYGTGTIPGFIVEPPQIQSFTPMAAGRRDTVTINGNYFNSVTQVYFGGWPAESFSVVTPNQIKAVVGGGQTGPVGMRTVRGLAKSWFEFTMPSAPVINAAGPATGQIGSSIKITGNNFSAVPSKNIVWFGAVKAKVLAASKTELTVEVPTGATYERLNIMNDETKLSCSSTYSVDLTTVVTGQIDSSLFAPAQVYSNSSYYESLMLVVCDFNGDGKPDITGEADVSLLPIRKNMSTKGNLSFPERILLNTGGYGGGGSHRDLIVTADMDGDGLKDIIGPQYIANEKGNFYVLRNISTADSILFEPQKNFGSVMNTMSVVVLDIDNDGRLDVIVQGQYDQMIFRNMSSGPGNISFKQERYRTGISWGDPIASDINGDGKDDIVYQDGFNVYYCANTTSDGLFSFADPIKIYDGLYDHYVRNISTGDIDGDGKTDIFFVNSSTSFGSFVVLRNNSQNNTVSYTPNYFSTRSIPYCGKLGDFDGDGKPDVVTGDDSYYSVTSVLKNNSTPGLISFAKAVEFPESAHAIAVADFDGDNKADIVLSSYNNDRIRILRNKSNEVTISYTGNTSFCSGKTLTLKSSFKTGNQWYKDGQPVTGATADSLVVSTGGYYSVKASSGGVDFFSIAGVQITVLPTPDKPTIKTGSNNILVSSALTGNQWYFGNIIINGETNREFKPIKSGYYKVQVNQNGCLSVFSDLYNFDSTAAANNSLGNSTVQITPNPVLHQLTVHYNSTLSLNLTVDIYNLNGFKVMELNNITDGSVITVSGLTRGFYFMRFIDITTGKLIFSTRFLKL